MMIRENDMRQRLNLIESSKSFVLKEVGSIGEATVTSPKIVPKDDGVYWVGGETKLKNGRELASVFRVDTDASGSLLSIYWQVEGNWYEHDSEETFQAIGIGRDDAFPFDWSYSVPLEEDAFHSV